MTETQAKNASHFLMDVWKSDVCGLDSDYCIGNLLWDISSADKFQYCLPVSASNQSGEDFKPKRERRDASVVNGRCSAKHLCRSLRAEKIDPHALISPYAYGESAGVCPEEKQPFKVMVHPQVSLLCDIHSHLSESEVIGLLAGYWDRTKSCLYIQAAFPCPTTNRLEDDGSTDVEMDAEGEFMARECIERLGLTIVGWYHSHPKFRAHPSLIDIFNQQQYQQMLRDTESNLEPFVGLIVSTFDKETVSDGPSVAGRHQWFSVREYEEENMKTGIHMPLHVDVEYVNLKLSNFEQPPETEKVSQPISLKDSVVEMNPFKTNDDPAVFNLYHILRKRSQSKSTSKSCKSLAEVGKDSARLDLVEDVFQDNKALNKRKRDDVRHSKISKSLSEEEAIYSSFTQSLQLKSLKSSKLARELIDLAPSELRYVIVNSISLGFYYSRFKHRVDLMNPWKGKLKIDKVQASADTWIAHFKDSDSENSSLQSQSILSKIFSFLKCCWEEYSASTGKLKRIARTRDDDL